MPYLRFSRDERGYESTYLVHTFRTKGRLRPRVLYWFRTPPGVRVGRPALDEEAIRAIEESHPGIAFDWPRILQARPPAQAVPRRDAGSPRRRRTADRRQAARRRLKSQDEDAAGEPREVPAPAPPPAELDGGALPPRVEAPVAEGLEEAATGLDPDRLWEVAAAAEGPVEGEADHQGFRPVAIHELPSDVRERLRARYAELLARITERAADPVRQEELRARAEALNPDAWLTAADVRQGLERYEQTYAELRQMLGRPRRRRRGRRGRSPKAPSGTGSPERSPEGPVSGSSTVGR